MNLFAVLEKAFAEIMARHQEGERVVPESLNSVLDGSVNRIDPDLMGAALRGGGDEQGAVQWLCTPMRALGHKRPVDAGIEEVIDLIGRFEHGFCA